jgi:hypothetical protein
LASLIGTLLREVSAEPAFGTNDLQAIAERQHELETFGLPEVTAAAPHLARFDREHEFNCALDSVVDFVASRIGHNHIGHLNSSASLQTWRNRIRHSSATTREIAPPHIEREPDDDELHDDGRRWGG